MLLLVLTNLISYLLLVVKEVFFFLVVPELAPVFENPLFSTQISASNHSIDKLPSPLKALGILIYGFKMSNFSPQI